MDEKRYRAMLLSPSHRKALAAFDKKEKAETRARIDRLKSSIKAQNSELASTKLALKFAREKMRKIGK